ncbi:MAG: lipopolysaccharide biosynthesis protein [Rhodocyclaceae bacterium]|nr:lipopolysaccharide biosynthesis protein [Rhodocyclaceae bacterium]
MNDELRSKAVRAITHLGLGGMVGKVLSLVMTVILVRLLSPADYGLMAMAMVVTGFVGFFNEVGIGAAIVQRQKLAAEEVNGCFAISCMLSTMLALLLAVGSGLVADFFGNRQLQPILSVLAIAFLFGGTATVPLAFLRKDMRYGAIVAVTTLGVIVQSVLGLVLAYLGNGVWSLVWGFMASSVVQCLGYFLLSGWYPRGRFGIRQASALVVYGLHITGSRIFWYLYSNADKVIVGRLLGARLLGIYDMAFSLATLPNSQVTTLVVNVSLTVFSRLQNDLPKLTTVILGMTRGMAYVTYPALIGLMAVSHELILVILGEKWLEMLLPFQALCLMGLVKSVDPLLSQVLISTGHARKLTAYTALAGVVMPLSLVLAALAGELRGVALVWVIVYPLLSTRLLGEVCRVTGMRRMDYYRDLLRVLTGALVMGGVVMILRELVVLAGLPVTLMLVAEIAAGIVTYVFWIAYADKAGLAEIRQTLMDLGVSHTRLGFWPFSRVGQT